jgi:hypothetical protein
VHEPVAEGERSRDCLVYALGGGADLLGIADSWPDHGELVTAQASDGVVVADCVAQARSQFAQELVTDVMSVLIVEPCAAERSSSCSRCGADSPRSWRRTDG